MEEKMNLSKRKIILYFISIILMTSTLISCTENRSGPSAGKFERVMSAHGFTIEYGDVGGHDDIELSIFALKSEMTYLSLIVFVTSEEAYQFFDFRRQLGITAAKYEGDDISYIWMLSQEVMFGYFLFDDSILRVVSSIEDFDEVIEYLSLFFPQLDMQDILEKSEFFDMVDAKEAYQGEFDFTLEKFEHIMSSMGIAVIVSDINTLGENASAVISSDTFLKIYLFNESRMARSFFESNAIGRHIDEESQSFGVAMNYGVINYVVAYDHEYYRVSILYDNHRYLGVTSKIEDKDHINQIIDLLVPEIDISNLEFGNEFISDSNTVRRDDLMNHIEGFLRGEHDYDWHDELVSWANRFSIPFSGIDVWSTVDVTVDLEEHRERFKGERCPFNLHNNFWWIPRWARFMVSNDPSEHGYFVRFNYQGIFFYGIFSKETESLGEALEEGIEGFEEFAYNEHGQVPILTDISQSSEKEVYSAMIPMVHESTGERGFAAVLAYPHEEHFVWIVIFIEEIYEDIETTARYFTELLIIYGLRASYY